MPPCPLPGQGEQQSPGGCSCRVLKTSLLWLPLLLLSCCASAQHLLLLSFKLCWCVERGTGSALPHHSAASAGLSSCPCLQIHPAQPCLLSPWHGV